MHTIVLWKCAVVPFREGNLNMLHCRRSADEVDDAVVVVAAVVVVVVAVAVAVAVAIAAVVVVVVVVATVREYTCYLCTFPAGCLHASWWR